MMASHIISWLPTLEATDRIDLFDRLQVGARWNVDFIMMICLSTAIAEALVPPWQQWGLLWPRAYKKSQKVLLFFLPPT